MLPVDVGRRIDSIYLPYHYAIVRNLERFASRDIKPFVLVIHSCTPVYHGEQRPWAIGIAHSEDESVSRPVLNELGRDGGFLVGDNEPYAVDLNLDYTIVVHGLDLALPHMFIEFRQDLIATRATANHWADVLYDAIQAVDIPTM